jgi:parallel beta-helix repeat protein
MNRTVLAIGIIFLLIGASVVSSKIDECTLVGNTKGIEPTALAIPYDYQQQYEPHNPIYIHGDNDFTSENGVTGGSGTSYDPYIIEDWEISASYQNGIVIRNTSVFFEIEDCYIHGGGIFYDGIVFYNVTNGVIRNNILTENRNGTIFRTQGAGMKENSSLNKIYQNEIFNNAYDGIHFEHTGWSYHSENEIFLNNITGNTRGIFLVMSEENLVYNNNLISNSEIGVELFRCMGGGDDNKVFHNNFINNGGENGQGLCTCDCNDWDDGYPSGGNYWSDYSGEDNNDDGIGDEPYLIYNEYGEYDYDWYPLMEPSEDTIPPYTTISFDPPYPNGENGWYISNVTVTLEADDDTGVNATYYRINEEVWEIYESPFIISEEGNDILIDYYSDDIDGNVEDVKSATLDIDKTPPNVTVEVEVEKIGWRKWLITITITSNENTSGMDRVEFFLNDGLQSVVSGSGPTYSWSFIIYGGIPFSIKVIIYDIAGNYAVVVVNDTDISSFNLIKDIFTQQSINPFFFRLFERFPLLQRLMDVWR